LTSAIRRFEQLREAYTDAIPLRDRTPRRIRAATLAASLSQVLERTRLEIDLGLREATPEITGMRYQVDQCLLVARSKLCFTRRPKQ
jgi:hypothetical protein